MIHTVLPSSSSTKTIRCQAALHFPGCNRFLINTGFSNPLQFFGTWIQFTYKRKLIFLSNNVIFKANVGLTHWKFILLPFEQYFSSWTHEYLKTWLKTKKEATFLPPLPHVFLLAPDLTCSFQFWSYNLLLKASHMLFHLFYLAFISLSHTKDRRH